MKSFSGIDIWIPFLIKKSVMMTYVD